jgi:hypothetical protein
MGINKKMVVIKRRFMACWFVVPLVLSTLNIAGVTDITPFERMDPDQPYAAQFLKPAGWILVFWIFVPGLLLTLGWAFKPVLDQQVEKYKNDQN